MGLTSEGMQPFERGGSLAVCNGGIYGFGKLKGDLTAKGYSFASDSDCERLLPLWFEYERSAQRIITCAAVITPKHFAR